MKATQVIVSEPKCWESLVVTLTFGPKMYRHLPLTILHLCMKYVRWKLLKLLCLNQNVDKVQLWPWPFDPKCMGISLSTSCFYVWNLYDENYSSYCVRTKVLTKFRCDLDLCTKNVWVTSSHHPVWNLFVDNYPSYRVKTKVLIKVRCDLDLWTPKCIGNSCIYVWNMKAVHWKLLKLPKCWLTDRQGDETDSYRAPAWWRGAKYVSHTSSG